MSPLIPSLAQRMRALRAARGRSVADIARRVGVSESTYRDWEYGRQIKGEPYARIAEALGTTLVELMTGRAVNESILVELHEIERALARIRAQL